MLLLVTVKIRQDPQHLEALRCRHNNSHFKDNWSGHCGEMSCPNYKEKCPKHQIAGGSDDATCNREKVTASCPLTNGICTDQTGAHHTGLYAEYESIQAAQTDFGNLGYHVTRIEEVQLPDGYTIVSPPAS